MKTGRRQFLGTAAFLFAGATVGSVTLTGCGNTDTQAVRSRDNVSDKHLRNAEFGWSVRDLNNNRAYASFMVTGDLRISATNIDASYSPTATGTSAGSSRTSCQAWVSRGKTPKFNSASATALNANAASSDFGRIEIFKPDKLVINCDAAPTQDVFYSIVLDSWVPRNGADSQTERAVVARPSLALNAGDYLVFGIDHAGMPGNVAVRAVLEYV